MIDDRNGHRCYSAVVTKNGRYVNETKTIRSNRYKLRPLLRLQKNNQNVFTFELFIHEINIAVCTLCTMQWIGVRLFVVALLIYLLKTITSYTKYIVFDRI